MKKFKVLLYPNRNEAMSVKGAFLLLAIGLITGVLLICSCQIKSRGEKTHFNPPPSSSIKINKIYFCIHPYCWSVQGRSISRGAKWNAILAWELWTHTLHMDLISNMKPDEALIIIPSESTPPMKRLESHAKKILGRRCIIFQRKVPSMHWLLKIPDPTVRLFFDDNKKASKQRWIRELLTNRGRQKYSERLAQEIEGEIREISEKIGYDWSINSIKLMFYEKLLAQDIMQAFRKRGLIYDPQNVEGEAFGESFEHCAMDIKSMLPHYLGWAKPIETNFELSVSGAPFLINATFKEQVTLTGDVRLFLWEGKDGLPIAFLHRAAAYPSDPMLYAHLPVEGFSLEVRNSIGVLVRKIEDGGHLTVGIYTGTRKGSQFLEDYPYYLIARGISFKEFRSRLVNDNVEGVNLVTNGDFSVDNDPPNGWSTSGTLTTETGGKIGNCLMITQGDYANTSAYQTCSVTAGKLYNFTCYAKSGTEATFKVLLYDLDNGSEFWYTTQEAARDWSTSVTHTFEAPSGCYNIRIYLYQLASGGGTTIYCDEVSLSYKWRKEDSKKMLKIENDYRKK